MRSGPRLVRSSETGLRSQILFPEQNFLLAIEADSRPEDPIGWVQRNRHWIENSLLHHAAILFRGFQLSPMEFLNFANAIQPDEMPYLNGATPRQKFSDGIYLASSFPKELTLPQHHEMSYMRSWPMKVFFYCDLPARSGGETPICSTRTFMKRVDRAILRRFEEQGVSYLRNYSSELTSDWRTAFLSGDRRIVEEQCLASGLEFDWLEPEHLRTRGVAQGLAQHPATGEVLWHNHAINLALRSATPGALPPALQLMAPAYSPELVRQLKALDPNELPANALYGNGELIEQSVLEEIAGILEQEKVSFSWEKGDFLLLDNMLAFHGRNPFEGERRILTLLRAPFRSISDAGSQRKAEAA